MSAQTAKRRVFLLKTDSGSGKVLQIPSPKYLSWDTGSGFCTSKEAALFLDITAYTVSRYCRQGVLRGHIARFPKKSRHSACYVRREDVVEHFIKHSTEESWLFNFEDPDRGLYINGVEKMPLSVIIQMLEWRIGGNSLHLSEYYANENSGAK